MSIGERIIEKLVGTAPVRAIGKRAVARLDARERTTGRPSLSAPNRSVWALSRLRLLQAVPEGQVERLSRAVQVVAFPRRHVVLLEEDVDRVWLVLGGGVKLSRVGALGRRFVEAIVEPGDVFGRLSTAGSPTTYEAQMLEPTRIAAIPRTAFEELLRAHPDLSFTVVQQLEDRQRRLVRRVESLVFKDVRARVADTLLDLATEDLSPCRHGFAVDLRITQQDLADLVGASRQMVNRVLGELSRELYVQRVGRTICILHMERLQRLADAYGSEVSTG
jgi:CRP/FNR family cyclic AMP-dependent transcriptional regulator